jgi:hypothetical protein
MSTHNVAAEMKANAASGVASVSGNAYTQTYSTAARTVPEATVVAQVTTALVDAVTGNFAYDTAAQGEAIPVAINALAADLLALKKVVTALIDDLQTASIVD